MTSPQKTRKNTDFKVRVAIRVRPSKLKSVVNVANPQVSISSGRTFTFDCCFGPSSTQQELYEQFGHDIVEHTLEGYNGCILAYGQTGSGKSHTMLGDNADGLIPQICRSIFGHVDKVQTSTAVSIRISFLEIYNEQIRDLLNPSSGTKLRLRGSSGDDTYVESLSEYKVSNLAEVLALLTRGAGSRATAATKMNDQSSRSHAVVSLTIKQQVVASAESGAETKEKLSVLRLVDLAGSERAGSTGATGERLREGSNINQSLVTLGRVISALAAQPTTGMVPYRDSKLTRLLQNSLGGNSRTAMIACVAPDAANSEQTLSTLRYADQAKRITNKARINQDLISSKTQEERFITMQNELNSLRQQLADREQSEGDAKLAKLVQFYEDEAAREKVRSRMLEAQHSASEQRNQQLADYLREVSGRGISSIDVNEFSFEGLVKEQEILLRDVTKGRAGMAKSAEKWRAIAASV